MAFPYTMYGLKFDHNQTTPCSLSNPILSLIVSREAFCFIWFLASMHMSTCMKVYAA